MLTNLIQGIITALICNGFGKIVDNVCGRQITRLNKIKFSINKKHYLYNVRRKCRGNSVVRNDLLIKG